MHSVCKHISELDDIDMDMLRAREDLFPASVLAAVTLHVRVAPYRPLTASGNAGPSQGTSHLEASHVSSTTTGCFEYWWNPTQAHRVSARQSHDERNAEDPFLAMSFGHSCLVIADKCLELSLYDLVTLCH